MNITILKNYIFLILWVGYFALFFNWNLNPGFDYAKENIFYWNYIIQIINAFMAFFTVMWVIGAVNRTLEKILSKLADKTKNDIDNIAVDLLVRFIRTNKYFVSAYVFLLFISLPEKISHYIDKTIFIIFLIIFIYYATIIINVLFEKILIKQTRFRSLNKNLLDFVKKVLVVWAWIIGIITILSNLWYNVTALVTWAWIWGLAIALAAQKTLSNIFGAITVLLTKPFKLGDYVRIDGQVGTIKEMWLSHLTMVDKEGYYVLIPNEKLISTNIENLTKRETRRADFSIWVVYSTTLTKLKKWVSIIEKIFEKYEANGVLTEDHRVGFSSFWDFSLNIKATYFSLLNEDYKKFVKQREEINLEIKKEFEKAWIEMAFPTQEIFLHNIWQDK